MGGYHISQEIPLDNPALAVLSKCDMSEATSPTTAESFLVGQTPRLRGLLRMLVRNEYDAEDLLQVTLMQFLSKGPGHEVDHAPMWLMKTARNLALNHLRGERRRQNREQERPSAIQESSDPADAAINRESIERIRDCLGKLPLDVREPLYLHVVEGFSLRQIAEQIQIGKSTVATRVESGLIQLNRCFHGDTR